MKTTNKFWMILTTAMLIMMIGMLCNFKAVQTNGGRMPVYFEHEISTLTHFSYNENIKINNSFLSDKPYFLYSSIGDIFMSLGVSMVVALNVYLFIKRKKNETRNSKKSNNYM